MVQPETELWAALSALGLEPWDIPTAGPARAIATDRGAAINGEPVVEEEWPYDDESTFCMIPVPGGHHMVGSPRSRSW